MSSWYRFTNVNSGLVLDVKDSSLANDGPVIQWPAHGVPPSNQLWAMAPTVFQNHEPTAVTNRESKKVLDVKDASHENGAPVVQYEQHLANPANQLWRFEEISFGDGESGYLIRNENSGLVLDVKGASTENGAELIQWPAHPTRTIETPFDFPITEALPQYPYNQIWQLEPVLED
jgi:hypothetical protein